MKRLLAYITLMLIGGFPIRAVYAVNYYCQYGNQAVSNGATMAQVKAACGEPSQITQDVKEEHAAINQTQWVYAITHVNKDKTQTYIPTLVLVFNEKSRLIKITRYDVVTQALGPIFCATDDSLSLGLDRTEVLARCGFPTSQQTVASEASSERLRTIWHYITGPMQPGVSFIFEEGVVVDITTK